MEKKAKFNTPQKKKISNVQNINGAHFQCVNYHYAEFEYKGMKNV